MIAGSQLTGARAVQRRIALVALAVALLVLQVLVPPLALAVILAGAMLTLAAFRYPIIGFCALGFSVPWGSAFELSGGSLPITPTEVVAASLAAAWLVRLASDRELALSRAHLVPFVVLFLLALCLSIAASADIRASGREVVKWGEFAAVYLAGTAFIRTSAQVKWVARAVVAGGASQALLGVAQLALSHGPAAFAAERAFLRAYGTFDQPNPFAGYLNVILAVAVAWALIGPSAGRRIYAAAAVLLGAGLLASESRGALLAGLVAVSVMLVVVFPPLRRLVLPTAVVVLGASLVAAFGLLPLDPLQRALTAVGLGNVSFGDVTNANFSAVERAAHWLAGVRMFADHPVIGVGIGNYGSAYPAYHPRGWYPSLEHAHNIYINFAAETGTVGLTAYLLLVGSALWYSCAAMRLAHEPVYRATALGVMGAVLATSLHNIFDVLYVHGIATLLGLLLSLVSVSLADPQARRQNSPVHG